MYNKLLKLYNKRISDLTSLAFLWLFAILAFSIWSFYMGMNYKSEDWLTNIILSLVWVVIWMINGFIFKKAIEYKQEA